MPRKVQGGAESPGRGGRSYEVPAGKFKATCLALMDRVCETGVSYVVTKHGRPVARLVPVEEEARAPLFGCMRGTLLDYGDLINPIDEAWHADEDDE